MFRADEFSAPREVVVDGTRTKTLKPIARDSALRAPGVGGRR